VLSLETNTTTVQGEHSQHVSRRLTIEFPAKRLKSRKESAENVSALVEGTASIESASGAERATAARPEALESRA